MTSSRARLAAVIAVLVVSITAGGWVVERGFRQNHPPASAHLFDQVMARISQNYVDSIDVGRLYEHAAAGVVSELGDPHSVFLDSTRLARVKGSISGLIGTLGLDVDRRDGWITVIAAVPGTPAEQAGLRSGDRITAIEHRSTFGWTADEARRALRGSPGTSVRVTVQRLGAASRSTDLVLEREALYLRPVQRAMLVAGDVGYVSLRTFSDSAALELTDAIDSLYAAGMRAVILDLRGNPGGLLSQGAAVADLFLDEGKTIVTLRGRAADARREYVDEHPQRWKALRVAVLIDRGTASASEIVAGALQDHDRAIVIGRPSYGKGSAQGVFSFHEQAGVKLTTARWFTPAGRNIDVNMPLPPGDPLAIHDDTARPVFKTDSGRTVYGGGGIVPDIFAGDSIAGPRALLFAALGGEMRKFRDAVAGEAKALVAQGVKDPLFEVTPAMRAAVYQRLERSGVHVTRSVFDGAGDWIDRRIGEQTTRLAFGPAAESRRIVMRDRVVEQAAKLLEERVARSGQRADKGTRN
jgi:carboxyl-terminal processing protease